MDKTQNKNITQKISALMALAANYGDDFPKELMAMWLELLKPYNASDVEYGVKYVLENYIFKTRPPFAVLKKAIDRQKDKISAEQALELTANAEWNKLLDEISQYGRYREPKHEMTTDYVLQGMGGWEAACNWETDKLEWKRKEFLDSWKLAYGNVDHMRLGALGISQLRDGPQHVAEILDFGKKNKLEIGE